MAGAEGPALLALIAFYLLTVLPNIGNHPIVGGDEGWIISASATLARDGRFGSDLFAGFYGADEHYFFNLPLHHLVLAGVFKVLGVGIAQARLLSAAYGLASLLLTWALARRLGGAVVGVTAAALLVLLRLNLTPFTGLTLTDLGATVRYDLMSLPYGLAAIVLLYRSPSPSRARVAGAGVLIGLASLTQFIGAFFLPPLLLFLLTLSLPMARRLALAGLLCAATLVPFVPYAAYVLPHWEDFRGQARAVEQRTDLLSPAFYLDNLRREHERYRLGTGLASLPDDLRDAARRPSARLAILILGPAGALYALFRALRGSAGHRLLFLLLVGMSLEFALLESTKRFVYWVVAVPFLCIAVADISWAVWRERRRAGRARALVTALAAGVGLVITLEGSAVGLANVPDAARAESYDALGAEVLRLAPAGSAVLGDNRLWPALEKSHQVRSLLLLFYFTNPGISRQQATDVSGAMRRIDADYLLLSPLSREILAKLSPRDSAAFNRYLAANASPMGTVLGQPYGPIDVYRLAR